MQSARSDVEGKRRSGPDKGTCPVLSNLRLTTVDEELDAVHEACLI